MKNSLSCPLVSAVLLGACGGSAPVAEDTVETVEVVEETSEFELGFEIELDPFIATAPETMSAVVTEVDPETLVVPAPELPLVSQGFDLVLSEYVTDDGGFRYEALGENEEHSVLLASFLADVADADLASMGDDARLAFLINAYNAYTIASVIELWPIDGVLEEDGFFDRREHLVGGASMTLNTLENEHVRAAFGEPRIHFVVNCASTGCPWLSPEAITADNLEMMLDRQSRAFVQRTTALHGHAAGVSQIFDWFASDFDASGGVRQFLVDHLDNERGDALENGRIDIEFFDYDWSVNAR
ncbi:MAG: hypothetical protein ACJAYU_003234 [Bradymonadia bacterium]|jgi:hypothetical protein